MLDPSPFLGGWDHAGRLVEVARRGDRILVLRAGVPEDCAPCVVPSGTGATTAVLRGGPYDGLTVEAADRGGVQVLVLGGLVVLSRWDAGTAPVLSIPVPVRDPEPPVAEAFERFLAGALAAGGAAVAPPPGLALGPWIGWASRRGAVLFHGSGDGDIDQMLPRRVSYELRDVTGRGNRPAVYATDDGWWAQWFAVVDRARLRGSIRSDVESYTRPDGSQLRAYSFSVDHRQLPLRPWRDGWLYLLPRDTFERLPLVPGGPPSHEWCSVDPVTPLARIRVTPEDFPFLDSVGAHDDGGLLRFGELGHLVDGHADRARVTERGVAVRLRWDDEIAGVTEEYLRLAHAFVPDIRRRVEIGPDGDRWLHVDAPPNMVGMVRNGYAHLID